MNIPKPTLWRHFKEINTNIKLGRSKDVAENIEKELL